MILDPTNPLQVSFVEKVNFEIGNLMTTLLATQIERDVFKRDLIAKMTENENLQQQVIDMGRANTNLKNDLELSRKGKK